MIHILLHFAVPPLVALLFYRSRWQRAALIMVGTMLVDLDHLLADPIYEPERCSIDFHPLHSVPAIAIYCVLFALPLLERWKRLAQGWHARLHILHLAGLGLLIHMALDLVDCAM